MSRMLAERYLSGHYVHAVPDWHASDGPWKARKVLAMIERGGLAPMTVGDVGCGAGEVLAHLQGALAPETLLSGYDIAPRAIELCREKENPRLRFHHADFLADTDDVFDLVLALDVFEHVADYLGFLAALRGRGKRFIFHIPLDVSAQTVARGSEHMLFMREKYGHLHHFTEPIALGTLVSAGYRVLDRLHTWDGDLAAPRPLRWRLAHPLRALTLALERLAFAHRPAFTAALRPHYNLLVLAEPVWPASA